MSVTAVPIRPLKKGAVLKLWIGLALLCLGGAALAWFGTSRLQIITTDSGLRYQVVREGTGEPATDADLVATRYKLHLNGPGGTLIQDSEQTGQPFVASTQTVFPGMAEALLMMREGGRYNLWVPPALAYGNNVPPGAPFTANDTLFFEIEVSQIARGMAAMQSMMAPQGGGASPHGGDAGAAPPSGSTAGDSPAPESPGPGNSQGR